MHIRNSWFFAFSIALAGCGSGCDGERARVPVRPRPPAESHHEIAPAASPGEPAEPAAPQATAPRTSYLDAPMGSLEALFRGFDAAERRDPSGRVLVAFFGDSHTAGDSMTSRIRVGWQRKFGDAGRGLVAAGRPPSKHYYQRDVRYGADGKWKAAVGGHKQDPEPYGIAGLRVYGDKKGADLWVETCADCLAGQRVAQFEVLFQSAPDHGVLKLRVDDGPWEMLPTKTSAIQPPHPARHVIPVPDGPHKLTLEHGGGGVIDLYGVAMERMRPGVIVDSLGVVGRRLGSLRSWDWSVIGEQLSTRDPRLVVLQYGTNEADDPDLDLEELARYYDDTILRIRAAAPTASILILGPPDSAMRDAGKACDPKRKDKDKDKGKGKGKGKSTERDRERDRAAGDGDAPPAEPVAVTPECQWHTPAVLKEIIAVQHAAALRNHVAFFDSFAAMGGGERMDGWFLGEPKVAYKDRVHFTDVGYQMWADELSKAILGTYEAWRHTTGLPPSGSVVPATSYGGPGAPGPTRPSSP